MPIVKQGDPLPPWDSLTEEEERRLHQRVDAVLLHDGRGFAAQIVAIRSIGARGDARSYDVTVFLDAPEGLVVSSADVAGLATHIVNEVDGIGRVLLDVTPHANPGGS
jgi:GMP synthase PP-ATPase subunit